MSSALENEVVTRYLTELHRLLHGPAHARADVVEEVGGGISDSAEAFAAQGLTPESAIEAALADFGEPAVVASAFAGELAVARARQILWWLLITGPLVGIWWPLLLASKWEGFLPAGLIAAIPVLPLIAAAVVTGVLVLAASGSLIRWVPEVTPRQALLAATAVGGVCIVADTALLIALSARVAAGATFPPLLVAAAVTASGGRLFGVIWAVVRCLGAMRHLGKP